MQNKNCFTYTASLKFEGSSAVIVYNHYFGKNIQKIILYTLRYVKSKPFHKNFLSLLRKISNEAPNFQPATVVLQWCYPLTTSTNPKTIFPFFLSINLHPNFCARAKAQAHQ